METEINRSIILKTKSKRGLNLFRRKNRGISEEDQEIVLALNDLSKEMNSLHLRLNSITDPDLIDAYIYDIKAVGMRYKYYLELCKQKGIIADVFQ